MHTCSSLTTLARIVERKGLVERSEIESRRRYIDNTRRTVGTLKDDLTSLETRMRIQMDQRNVCLARVCIPH